MTQKERIDALMTGPRVFRHGRARGLTLGEYELLDYIRKMGAELARDLAAPGAYIDYRKRQARARMKAA